MDTLGDAEIVVIGGGASAAVSHSLCQAGKTDVLLPKKTRHLRRNHLAGGRPR